jgi:hypothetical protein
VGRDFDRRPRSGSTHHEPHRPVTTPECRSQLPLSIDRPPPRSANGSRYASSHARGYPARFSTMARDRSAAAISRRGPCPTITTPAPHLSTCGSQIPIDRARRTTAPPSCPRFPPLRLIRRLPTEPAARSVFARRLITLNNRRHALASGSQQRRPSQWHLRAGGGAVHSIKSRHLSNV